MGGTLCAILAAGHSRRFGATDKLLAPLYEQPLVSHAAEACLAAKFDHLIAVTRRADVQVVLDDMGIKTLCIDGDDRPQSDSVKAAARHAKDIDADRLLIVLGDMPFVTTAHLKAVAKAEGLPSATASGDRRCPPACFPRTHFDALLAVEDDQGARALLRSLPESSLIQAPAASLLDIDTPEDLARL